MKSTHTRASIHGPIVTRRRSAAAIVGLAAVAGFAMSASGQSIRYTVTDVGTLPGSNVCHCFFAAAISQNATVTGYYFGAQGERRGFMWRDGVIVDVGGAPGTDHVALGVNDDGVTVGFGDAFAFSAQNGIVTDLPTLGGPYGDARTINNAGAIVGSATDRNFGTSIQHAARWIDGDITDLGTLGGEGSQAFGINEAGQVVGWAWDPGRRQRAFVWSEVGGMVQLPSPPGGDFSTAIDINEAGHIVGSANVEIMVGEPPQRSFMSRAFLWTGGAPIDLGDLNDPGATSIGASAINDSGRIVGTVSRYPLDFDRPFIWEDGVMTDLNTLIDPDSGWMIIVAADINNAGVIVATARHNEGQFRTVVLTPVGTPCAADFNADGLANSQDYFDFLSAFFGSLPSADVNGDGNINSQDYFDFLPAFFTGC